MLIVKKKDGSNRVVIDYRRLNNITKKDNYPLPRIDNALDKLGGAQYFSAMDLVSGYWQIDMGRRTKRNVLSLLHKVYSNLRVCHKDFATPQQLSNNTWILC